jgi:hypothetical protein
MLLLMPFLLALAADPGPAPQPAASSVPAAASRPTPLTEIGRVRALPACVPIVAHANGAITQALDNDRALAILSTNLHATDYDKMNWLQRRNAMETLMKQGEAVRAASRAGDAEIKRLRELAKVSPDPTRKQELKTFADALGGALARQAKAAAEMMRDITIIRGREEAQEARETMKADNVVPPNLYAMQQTTNVQAPLPVPDPIYNKQMKAIGDTLLDLNLPISLDEGIAADHSIAATSGC